MLKAALLLAMVLSSMSARAEPVTSASEQRGLVEALSGAAQLGVGGLPTVLSQRFSDSPEILTTAQFLKAKYEAAGIAAEILPYDPRDAFPYYFQSTNQTYRTYFKRMLPMLQADFDGLCAGTLSDERKQVVVKRLARVALEQSALCAEPSPDRVELYIRTTVAYSTNLTKKMLDGRSLATWPNVVATVRTGEAPGEAGVRPLCVVGAHMDSVARDGGGRGPIISPGTLAPGADDNGSGTAAVLTLARSLRDWLQSHPMFIDPGCDLAFVHFSGEEEGLLGSLAYTRLQASRPIKWMVNFDMIAFNGASGALAPAVNVGYDKTFGRALADAFAAGEPALKTVIVERGDFIYSSDQIAFWEIGVPAISISEQACAEAACSDPFKLFNPNLHTPGDVASILDFEYDAQIVNRSFAGLTKLLLNGRGY